jgi:hypothetical protein
MSGAEVACSAASSARLRLDDAPTPSMAVPELAMMAFTSAKSTFTSPGVVMMSEMPCARPDVRFCRGRFHRPGFNAPKKATWFGISIRKIRVSTFALDFN